MPNNLRKIVPVHGSKVAWFPVKVYQLFKFFPPSVVLNIVLWKDLCSLYHPSISLLLAVTYLAVRPFLCIGPMLELKVSLAPALVGNVVVWKPSPAATYSNYIIHQIFTEAGVPPGVIQFVPGPPPEVVAQAINHPSFAALHFTGSTFVFKKLWKDIAMNIDKYRSYPRIVGETGGKNFHVIHQSAEIKNAVIQSVRGAFEYQG
jgi:delta 1-pyrroline-5-carboxylate dehydrogenase